MNAMQTEVKINDKFVIEGKTLYVTEILENGEVILDESPKRVIKPPILGEEIIIDNESHYVTEIKADGSVVLNSFTEMLESRACNNCHFFCKGNGFMPRENHFVRVGGKKMEKPMSIVFSCGVGQFPLTHNVVRLPNQCSLCSLKNYNEPSEESKAEKIITEFSEKMKDVLGGKIITKILVPMLYGTQIVDVLNKKIRFVFRNKVWGEEQNE